jgi:hypothetical protein
MQMQGPHIDNRYISISGLQLELPRARTRVDAYVVRSEAGELLWTVWAPAGFSGKLKAGPGEMLFLVLLFLACAVIASATSRHSPELYFKKGEKYSILGTRTLAVVVEDDVRQYAHSNRAPKLAVSDSQSIARLGSVV